MSTLSPHDAHLIRLLHAGITQRTLNRLYALGYNPKTMTIPTVNEQSGITTRQRERLHAVATVSADAPLRAAARDHLSVLTRADTQKFPSLLHHCADAPFALCVRGATDVCNRNAPYVAIVGARACSRDGERAAFSLAADLARGGAIIVSGMARGIDTAAHRGALSVGGQTIAVLGGGVDTDTLYPRSNRGLADAIAGGGGAVLSAYAPLHRPTRYTLVERNRVMAGMSHSVIVIEAGERSGTLRTAQAALDYDRDLGAVPGSIFDHRYAGSLALIRNGAACIRNSTDIWELLGYNYQHLSPSDNTAKTVSESTPELSESERAVLRHIECDTPCHIDKIIAASKLEATQVRSALSLLEIAGTIRNCGGDHYLRTS